MSTTTIIDRDWLDRHLSTEIKTIAYGYIIKDLAPRITCADGYSVSVQASRTSYCSPRDDHGPWHEVEAGFALNPDGEYIAVAEWAMWAEDKERGNTVYGYMPIEEVIKWVNSHGGVVPPTMAEPPTEAM